MCKPIEPKAEKFRCPKGHQWEGSGFQMLLYRSADDDPAELKLNCPYCIMDFYSEHFPAEKIRD
jgi:hypothetical protein